MAAKNEPFAEQLAAGFLEQDLTRLSRSTCHAPVIKMHLQNS
jgi:hypothetical protein